MKIGEAMYANQGQSTSTDSKSSSENESKGKENVKDAEFTEKKN